MRDRKSNRPADPPRNGRCEPRQEVAVKLRPSEFAPGATRYRPPIPNGNAPPPFLFTGPVTRSVTVGPLDETSKVLPGSIFALFESRAFFRSSAIFRATSELS